MRKKDKFLLKPHHFLDIIKLYGAGTDFFVPEEEYVRQIRGVRGKRREYHHDFNIAGNIVLENPLAVITLTVGVDDVCSPCKFLVDGKCTDKLSSQFTYPSKEEWNQIVDKRMLDVWDLKEGDEITAIALCQLSRDKFTPEVVLDAWRENTKEEALERAEYLIDGLKKYVKRYKDLLGE